MKKYGFIICWLLPAFLGIIIIIRILRLDILTNINLHAIAAIIGVLSLFMNAVVFRPPFGASRTEGPEPVNQVQRLLHVVVTAVFIFVIIKYF